MGVTDVVDRERKQATSEGEPLYVEEREVVENNGSYYGNIPSEARRLVAFGKKGDPLEVQIYRDHIRLVPGDADE